MMLASRSKIEDLLSVYRSCENSNTFLSGSMGASEVLIRHIPPLEPPGINSREFSRKQTIQSDSISLHLAVSACSLVLRGFPGN